MAAWGLAMVAKPITDVVTTLEELQTKLADPEQLSELFHMVNRILPEGQVVIDVPPDTPARDALRIMQEHGYSQLPVTEGETVLGLFSYRAFALEVARNENPKIDVVSLPVEEFLEHDTPVYASLRDEFPDLISALDEKDAVVVSGPESLQAILTPMDVLNYLYAVANAFVLIEEIEVNLRSLIQMCIPDDEAFAVCVSNALSKKYQGLEMPRHLEEMTFDEYIALLRDGRNWPLFERVFGGRRERVNGKLEPIRNLRNDVFHFRRELSIEDHEQLANCRNWLLRCTLKVRARLRGAS